MCASKARFIRHTSGSHGSQKSAVLIQQSWVLRKEKGASLKAELAGVKQKVKLEAQLRMASDDLRRVQRDFKKTSSTRHDLRQPLTSLRAAVENIGASDIAEKLRAGLDYITTVLDPTLRNEEAIHDQKPTRSEDIAEQLLFDTLEPTASVTEVDLARL